MRRLVAFLGGSLLLGMAILALSQVAMARTPADSEVCEEAIAAAEGPSGLPAGLLGAIARSESGRYDAAARRVRPWPWAINAAGAGSYAPTRDAAVAQVRDLLARGVRLIDVGCMQINLHHHPGAFASLEEAFEPRANVAYAVRFLLDLHRRRGDWSAAIAHYHSADPARGEEYARRVGLAWGQPVAPARPPTEPPGLLTSRLAVFPAPAALRVRVITPNALPAAALRVRVITPSALTPAAGLMNVITLPSRRGPRG